MLLEIITEECRFALTTVGRICAYYLNALVNDLLESRGGASAHFGKRAKSLQELSELFAGEKDPGGRMALIAEYGASKYWTEVGASRLHGDSFGVVFRHVEHPRCSQAASKAAGECCADNECQVSYYLCVVNSTPEPDGSSKEYSLRVPPYMTSARQAVAWTFGMEENEYSPAFES